MKSKLSESLLYLSFLTFIVFVVYLFHVNHEVLYTAHGRSEFLVGTPFFQALMLKPFGLIQYVGAWLTQFFYNPVLGAVALGAIWLMIYGIGVKAFRLQGSASALMLLPIACLLASIFDLGYWIYISTIRGYWFSQSVGYLLMALLLWAARSTPRKYHIGWYLFAFCAYPILGWFALLFVLCLAFAEKPTWRELVGFVLLLFTSSIWRTLLYSHLKLDDVMFAGLPCFVTPSDKSEYLSLPFWLLGAVSILIALFGRYLSKSYVPVLCAAAGIVFAWTLSFKDRNYIDEMRMVRNAESDNWEEVLRVAAENRKPTISMVMLKNIALMYKGGLLDRSFQMGNDAVPIYNPDSLHVSFLEIAAPVSYYNYGMINEGFRLNFECAVQSGFSPFYLKMLSRCALANGETKLVERYTNILHAHPFYANWQPAPVKEEIRQLHKAYKDELTGVENSDSYLVNSISLWYESNSKLASEQALFYSMLRCDSRRFWASIRKYVELRPNGNFPLHAQEAYIMFMDKAPEEKRIMLPVNQATYDRYQEFWTTIEDLVRNGVNQKDIPEKMCERFGDTYWFYNIFGRKIY